MGFLKRLLTQQISAIEQVRLVWRENCMSPNNTVPAIPVVSKFLGRKFRAARVFGVVVASVGMTVEAQRNRIL
jgi:hypothetical protein